MIQPDTVLYSSDDSEASLVDARQYIKQMKLTKEDVKLVKRDGMILVVSKRGLWS